MASTIESYKIGTYKHTDGLVTYMYYEAGDNFYLGEIFTLARERVTALWDGNSGALLSCHTKKNSGWSRSPVMTSVLTQAAVH